MNYHKYFLFEEDDQVFGYPISQSLGLCLKPAKGNQTGGVIFILFADIVIRITEPDPAMLAQVWQSLSDPTGTTASLPGSEGQTIARVPYKDPKQPNSPATASVQTEADLSNRPTVANKPPGHFTTKTAG
ncbi:MAG TPA: hypothetical protein VFE51_05960 [Verrucomicrobiae bacterium]|nr:hypothetical protein [Verrucomicrobiae bacterium]